MKNRCSKLLTEKNEFQLEISRLQRLHDKQETQKTQLREQIATLQKDVENLQEEMEEKLGESKVSLQKVAYMEK